eukprot:COSAG01_NODE_63774_length_278_cov_7.234637_2_plen_40_part_01
MRGREYGRTDLQHLQCVGGINVKARVANCDRLFDGCLERV